MEELKKQWMEDLNDFINYTKNKNCNGKTYSITFQTQKVFIKIERVNDCFHIYHNDLLMKSYTNEEEVCKDVISVLVYYSMDNITNN